MKNIKINFNLDPGTTLEEAVVTGEEFNKIEDQVQMSKVEIPIDQIKRLPAIGGEVDLLRVLQLMPGVQSGGEGTSGLYVRGGSPDQNLMLLDGVPLYNVNHLFGFFSVFNADAVRNMSLTKGGFPARFGGRLSSILEIHMKDGNMKEYHGDATVSIIAAKAFGDNLSVGDIKFPAALLTNPSIFLYFLYKVSYGDRFSVCNIKDITLYLCIFRVK